MPPKKYPRKSIAKVTAGEFKEHTDNYDGLCLACGAWSEGDCEPDAREYPCQECEEDAVMGAEDALMEGYVTLTNEEYDYTGEEIE